MLLRYHGASTLGKNFRRPIITGMSSFDGTTTLSGDALRSTYEIFRGGRAVSSSSRNLMGEQKLWSPLNGIVFGNSPNGSPRLMTSTAAADLMPDSNTKDRSVMITETDTTESASVLTAEKPGEVPERVAETEPDDPETHDLPRTKSIFKMSEEVFRAAKNAAPGSLDSFWTHALYRGPEQDGVQPKVKLHYCRSKHTTERTLRQYFLDKKVLGFDIEWQPEAHRNSGAKKNVSLVQLASEDRIGLFHIALYPKDDGIDLVAPSLRTIMEDPTITKVGVAIKADCTRLRKFLKIESRGIFELSHLHKLVKFSSSEDFKLINKRLVSLSTQVQEHLHLPIYKGDNVRSSDWSQPLQLEQIVYAASDAYAGVHLFDVMEIKRNNLDPTPPRPYNAEENKPIRVADGIEIPTDEELEPDEETSASKRAYYTKRSPSYFKDAALEIENLDPEFSISTPQLTNPTPTRSKSAKTAPQSPLVLEAAALADLYRATHPKIKATPSSLRCYYLWYHNPDLSLTDIAGVLREVPLQTTTVVNYILEAVRAEKMPFERERLRSVLSELPKEVMAGRYRTLSRACEDKEVGKI